MNTSILQKCLAELQKETPDLSYIRGMLETLIDMQPNTASVNPWPTVDNGTINTSIENVYKGSYPSLVNSVASQGIPDTPEGMAVEAALASLQGMPMPKMGVIEKNIIL